MKILFLVENYYDFYTKYIQNHPDLQKKSYEDQCLILFEQHFYQSDSYAYGMKQLGYDTSQVIMDCKPLQHKWSREHGLFVSPNWFSRCLSVLCSVITLRNPDFSFQWQKQILLEQIKRIKPDIIFCFSGVPINKKILSDVKKYIRYLVCQWSCPIPEDYPFRYYDLIISSSKALVERFHDMGHKCEYLPQAFDDRILTRIDTNGSRNGVVFIGSFSPKVHKGRIKLLEYLSKHINIDIYGPSKFLLECQSLHKNFCGEAFGLEMYRIYSRYKIAIHAHGEVAGDFVGAKRLFEVTGVGTLLLTDNKKDTKDFFRTGEEIITYTDEVDCLNKIRYYLAHEDGCISIAKAGQRRTLSNHTFGICMKELAAIIEKNIQNR